jgi:hypothetical protein
VLEINDLHARARRFALVRRKREGQGAVPRTMDENDEDEDEEEKEE